MKKTTMKMLGTLTIAAALTMTTGLTACSSDNDLVETPNPEQPAQPTATGVKVTVTAGIGDGATTRSAVTTDGTTRTLTFTAGDRLYIHGEIYDNHPSSPDYDESKEEVETILAGYLDIDGTSISGDGTTASFSGTLHTYDVYTGDEVAYDFNDADPLAMCNYTNNEGYGEPAHAYLVHNGTMEGSYTIDGGVGFRYKPEDMFADDVETLMTKALFVMGRYDGSTGFTLSADCPILNCTLSGLKASHDYTATLASNTYSYYSNFTYDIHTDADGTCAFAISTYMVESTHRYITIKDGDDVVGTIDLGTRTLAAKVYNVSRYWSGSAFVKAEPKEIPLTMQALTDGTIMVTVPRSGMQYSLNGGEKTTMTETTTINVSEGDKVQFYGDGTSISSYYASSADYTEIAGGDAEVKVYGNIMSLVDETGYASNTTLTSNYAFQDLFHNNSKLKDASGLLLPATKLSAGCYSEMFFGCTSLTAAPTLPATRLTDYCYTSMFYGCSSLKSVTCLATNISATDCTKNWLKNVASKGTFTAANENVNWGNGPNGIPSGWKRVNAQ